MILRYTPEARRDLRGIKKYLSENADTAFADKIGQSIVEACSGLKDTPYIGVTTMERYDIQTDMRILIIGRYIAFYRIHKDVVEVVRIFDTSMDIMFRMFGIDESTDDEWD